MRRIASVALLLWSLLALIGLSATDGRTETPDVSPALSALAMMSGFARRNGIAVGEPTIPISQADDQSFSPSSAAPTGPDIRVNQDFSEEPQNEPTVAVSPTSPNLIIAGGNDYRLGVPTGAAFYTSENGGVTWTDGILPFPLLAGPPAAPNGSPIAAAGGDPDAPGGKSAQFTEPPSGTGDPVVAFGKARPVSSDPVLTGKTVAYYGYLGVSASFCEHGIFVTRSTDGLKWEQPIVPTRLPRAGLFTPVYWDQTDDCTVFNDKPWIAVDRSGGLHDGRVYVVWARFLYEDGDFQQSTIEMEYSDDDAETWSAPINVSGASAELCPAQVRGRAGQCDESQFASAVVGPDGVLHVAFINQQAHGAEDGFRNQYLVTSINPDTLERSGPYHAASLVDGKRDLPVNGRGLPTLCNANFRVNMFGNLALDPSDPTGKTMYIVFADNRNGTSFDEDTVVSQDPVDTFLCPEGKRTSTDIFIVRSTDGGVSWVNPKTNQPGDLRVNQDSSGNDHWFPFVAVSSTGRLSVVFEDRRDDSFNRLTNTYVATSDDNGANWSEDKASSAASNLNYAFGDWRVSKDAGSFIGDYNALAFAPDGTGYALWTDARPDIHRSALVRQSDIYAAILPP